ncbi:MAG: GAF domain-containing protein [Mesorhizobium sp.]|nr:MAG: GAF domain-containing protein [Mesorhizobium sp.]
MARRTVGPFSQRQIELVESFADQAVIAIENVRLFDEVQARNREVTESLERETSTGSILRVIAASPTDIQPVLDAVAESAARLCEAYDATIYLRQGDRLAVGAHHGPIPVDDAGVPVARDVVPGRAVLDRAPVHVHDLTEAGVDFATGRAMAHRLGFRTILAIPLLRDGEAVGALMIRRIEIRPFTDKQIALLKTFADQAVIAISNVRLFEEVQARTAELSEALRQQTATSEVLDVISRSIVELEPVFEVILENAARICDASFGNLALREGDGFRHVAAYGATEEWEEFKKGGSLMQPGPNTALGQALATRRYAHIDDVTNDPAFPEGDPLRTRVVALFKARTMLSVPLVKDDVVIGAITLHRQEVRPFTDKQIALVTSFASQAVIAIENARLFKQVQARTAELTEALEQQTATADVLKVISASTFDLKAVLQTLIDSAVKLCGAELGGIYMLDGDVYHISASHGHSPELRAHEEAHPNRVGRDSWVGRAALERAVVHVPDVTLDLEYGTPDVPTIGKFAGGLSVPLLREGTPIGVFSMARAKPGPFSERQIELVQTFADQAVIAIENVRLFEEVQQRTREATEALEYQTATSDVLGVISRSPTDVQPVFNMIAQSAARLCEAQFCFVYRYDGQLLHFVAHHGITEESVEIVRNTFPVAPTRGSAAERAILYLDVAQIPDLTLDSEFTHRAAAAFSGLRSAVAVPMLRDGLPIGCIAVGRAETGFLAAKQVELLKTFADQAVIAIENVRLFDEVQARTEELSRSLDDLRKAQDRLVQTEKLASLGQLTAGIAHEIKNPLNFVNNFSSLSGDLIVELRDALQGAALDDKTRAEIDELSDMLRGNLEKVVQHGKRADSIVRNMLLHSRSGSNEHRPVDINAVVEESLNLAYHGARAEGKGFNIMLERNFDPGAGEVDLFPQEITRVLLNLISNGFYATTKRRAAEGETGYEPVMAASTKSLGDAVEIRIRDNGTGIPPEVKEKMFNPFFTTKPAGEGTGLGLSLSHDIVVKQHAGTIEVVTEPGAFTEFRVVLPRGAATLAKAGGNA